MPASMTFEQRFLVASHVLAATGVFGVAATGMVHVAYTGLALLSLVWSFWCGWERKGYEIDRRLATVITVVTLAAIAFTIFFGEANPVQAIAGFLLVLTAIKVVAQKQNRDWIQIYVLSFFHIVAASALTIEPLFAVVFVVYLILAPWVLVLLHIRREVSESTDAPRLEEEAFVDPRLFRTVAGMSALMFVMTIVIFVLFPRVGSGFFSPGLDASNALTGFSDEVALGDVTALTTNDAIAMRVVVDRPKLVLAEPRYWHGAILDTYDGQKWQRSRQQKFRSVPAARPGLFFTTADFGRDPSLRQDILLEPMGLSNLLALGRVVEVRGPFSGLIQDPLGNLRAISRATAGRMRYEVVAALGPDHRPPTPNSREVPRNVDPGVAQLGRDIVEGLSRDAARADALFAYFRNGFSYTLDPVDPEGEDPLAHFLFETREGHCEYFASALAVMLRAVGIPSRVVTGYAGGKWNEYGEYFLIRQSDAHSWVEAWVGGSWRTYDPTPAAAPRAASPFANVAAILDAYRMRWYRYVINYSATDQFRIAFSLRDMSRSMRHSLSPSTWREWLSDKRESGEIPVRTYFLVAAVLVGGFLVLRRQRVVRRAREGGSLPPESRQYVEMLRLLERRGLSKRGAETAEEFAGRVEGTLPIEAETVRDVTRLYLESRFSGRPEIGERNRPEIERLLGDLTKAPPP